MQAALDRPQGNLEGPADLLVGEKSPLFTGGDQRPDFLVLVVAYAGMVLGARPATILGFIVGLVVDSEQESNMGTLVPITKSRQLIEQEIHDAAAEKVRVFGIELLDIRFKRINYNESVRPKIYGRMISERRQIAERFLSEGNGEAARIHGNRVRDLNKIQSEAYRQVEEIRGVADAKATEIYARAYNQSPEAVAFYEFTRTMQSYESIIAENTTLVLSTDSDLFKFLKGMSPDGQSVSARVTAGDRR